MPKHVNLASRQQAVFVDRCNQGRRAVKFFTTATQNWCPDKLSVPTEAYLVVFALKLKKTVIPSILYLRIQYFLLISKQIVFNYQHFMIVSILT